MSSEALYYLTAAHLSVPTFTNAAMDVLPSWVTAESSAPTSPPQRGRPWPPLHPHPACYYHNDGTTSRSWRSPLLVLIGALTVKHSPRALTMRLPQVPARGEKPWKASISGCSEYTGFRFLLPTSLCSPNSLQQMGILSNQNTYMCY